MSDDLIGRRINLTDHYGGFNLLTEGGTLWRPGARTGKVIAVTPGRFYQLQENVSWLTVRLDRNHGRYTTAQAYLDETTGELMHGTRWL